MYDERDPNQVKNVMEAGEEILKLCVDVGGSLTGEHGIGIEKSNVMPWLFAEVDLALMERIKRVFNANDLCNPGKVFPTAKRCWETEHGPHIAQRAAAPGRGAAV
jgi:glycolate oxidase